MPEKKSLSLFRCYSPNDPLCSCSSSAAVWLLGSQGFGGNCSWFNQSSVTSLQLCKILEFLLLGSSLYHVQASVISNRGQRPRADSRDWWPGRQDSVHHHRSSSCNFMPPSESYTDFLEIFVKCPFRMCPSQASLVTGRCRASWCFVSSGTYVLSVLGVPFTHAQNFGGAKSLPQSNQKEWWELLSTAITFVSGNSWATNSWRLGKGAGGISTSLCLVFVGCPKITLAVCGNAGSALGGVRRAEQTQTSHSLVKL